MSIGKRIKEQRKLRGLTQSQLAREIGLTLDMIKSMETNRSNPSIETVIKLVMLFNVSADYLLIDAPLLQKDLVDGFNNMNNADKQKVIDIIQGNNVNK